MTNNSEPKECIHGDLYVNCSACIAIEKMQIRCAGLAAEVERLQNVAEITNKELHRLQSVIDEANAQMALTNIQVLQGYPSIVSHSQCGVKDGIYKVYASPIPAQHAIEQAYMAGQASAGIDPSYSRSQIYAQSVGAQQSTAVAVPTNDQLSALESDLDKLNKNAPFYPADAATLANSCLWLIAEVRRLQSTPSPRITEQDALAILGDYFGFCLNSRLKPTSPTVTRMWVKKSFPVLLNKLNDKPESVGG